MHRCPRPGMLLFQVSGIWIMWDEDPKGSKIFRVWATSFETHPIG
jgi:hypothetical protein